MRVGVTITAWMTEGLHGVPTAVVAVMPIAVLAVAGVIGEREIRQRLPVSTPPNALVFATGHVAGRDLRGAGLVVGLVWLPLAVGWVARVGPLVLP